MLTRQSGVRALPPAAPSQLNGRSAEPASGRCGHAGGRSACGSGGPLGGFNGLRSRARIGVCWPLQPVRLRYTPETERLGRAEQLPVHIPHGLNRPACEARRTAQGGYSRSPKPAAGTQGRCSGGHHVQRAGQPRVLATAAGRAGAGLGGHAARCVAAGGRRLLAVLDMVLADVQLEKRAVGIAEPTQRASVRHGSGHVILPLPPYKPSTVQYRCARGEDGMEMSGHPAPLPGQQPRIAKRSANARPRHIALRVSRCQPTGAVTPPGATHAVQDRVPGTRQHRAETIRALTVRPGLSPGLSGARSCPRHEGRAVCQRMG